MQESVELPLTHPEYYEEMGIKPPKGVILYGAPGTGKNTHILIWLEPETRSLAHTSYECKRDANFDITNSH